MGTAQGKLEQDLDDEIIKMDRKINSRITKKKEIQKNKKKCGGREFHQLCDS